MGQKLVLGVFSRERKRPLREVIGSERKELGHFGKAQRANARAHDLDHA
jgi:hypothetical protein